MRNFFPLLLGLGWLFLAGCRGFTLGVANRLEADPGPTAVPLSDLAVTDLGLGEISLPSGFAIQVFAEELQGPRMLAVGPDGQLYVAERGADRVVRLPDRDANGQADSVEVVADGLENPNSLTFAPDGSLYVSETERVLRLDPQGPAGALGPPQVVISGLPGGGQHRTRSLAISPDGAWLYVSVGSSCNVCLEADSRRAAILRFRPDGSQESLFATGMRNAVGLAIHPDSADLWASNNGRDWLGDDLPPETVYRVLEGGDYGWPRCHAGRIPDPEFGGPDACEKVTDPAVEMQAHSAPLGLTFYEGTAFPPDYQGDLFVAFHGSWNRRTPTGYKVVRVPFGDGQPGQAQDFATGWLRADGSHWGRPVDVVSGPAGELFISDDFGGRIFRVFHRAEGG